MFKAPHRTIVEPVMERCLSSRAEPLNAKDNFLSRTLQTVMGIPCGGRGSFSFRSGRVFNRQLNLEKADFVFSITFFY